MENKLPVNEQSASKDIKESKPLESSYDYERRNQYNKPTNLPHHSKSHQSFNYNGYFSKGFDKSVPKPYQKNSDYQRNKSTEPQRNINEISHKDKELKPGPHLPKTKNIPDYEQNRQNITNTIAIPSLSSQEDKKNIQDTTHLMTKMSLNSQFATRSLRQHLNLGASKPPVNGVDSGQTSWNIGDKCLAKYWEDGKVSNSN